MYDNLIADWEDDYRLTGNAATVNFRSIVSSVSTDRYTHLLHSYPAKLLPHIPFLFLNSSLADLSEPNSAVVDPFCGSGTVLLEAAVRGFRVAGADTNPLARLVAKVKTKPLSPSTIERALSRVNRSFDRIKQADPPPVVNIDLWYGEEAIFHLAKLRKAISQIKSTDIRDFMQVCFSVCTRKVSFADPRMSVPVKIDLKRKVRYGPHYVQLRNHLKSLKTVSVRDRFNEIVRRNILRMNALREVMHQVPQVTLFSNALGLEKEEGLSDVQLIITSPPYAGAQKYIRASSLSLGWLDMAYEGGLRPLERQTIGREHYAASEVGGLRPLSISSADKVLAKVAKTYPLRAHIAHTYLVEMERALQSMYGILRPGGHLVLVSGPNSICGQHFDTPAFLEQLAQRIGFSTRFKLVDHIKSRGLMTKRNKTASIIASEVVLCMRKQ